MIDISRDINSLSNFKRNTPEFIRQMKESGHPMILTINGQPEIVVQDAHAYQQLLEQAERLRAIEGIAQGLKEVEKGDLRPLSDFDTELRAKYGIPG
jgi:PHD/YefM family antitoxin component YafN of YafNO toxin-antitoxin module